MKRRLALLLAVSLAVSGIDSGMLVSAADFSDAESVQESAAIESEAIESEAMESEDLDESDLSYGVDDIATDEEEKTEQDVSETEIPETEASDETDVETADASESESQELSIDDEAESGSELEEQTLEENFADVQELKEAVLDDGSEDVVMVSDSGTEVGTYNDLTYQVDENGDVTILKVIDDIHYDKDHKETGHDRCAYVNGNIPASINGHPVVRIENRAFANCINMQSIVIPDSVKSVGREAFSGCTAVTSVKIPDNGLIVEAAAFSECTSLTSVHIPASMVAHGYIGASPAYRGIFANDVGLTTVTFGAGITKIPRGLFLQCSGIRSVTVPNTVKDIEPYAFASCSALTSVTLPEGLENIYNCAFRKSGKLTSMKLPSTLKFMDSSVFANCTGLAEINIPAEMKTNGYTAANRAWPGPFAGCTNLKKVTFDKGIKEIPRGLFYAPGGQVAIEEIVLPDSVESIGYSAFYGCKSLKKVTLSKNLKFIDAEAFQYCENMKLTDSKLPASLEEIQHHAFANCISLTKIVLPDGLKYMNYREFERCTGLTEVGLPANMLGNNGRNFAGCENIKKVTFAKGVKTIPKGILAECTGLETITIPASVTYIAENAFQETAEGFTIKGYSGSYAETYAKQYSIPFVSLGDILPSTVKITFNKNAKSAVLNKKYQTKTVSNGKTYGKLPVPTRSGYYFLGWYTNSKTSGKEVTEKTKVKLKKNQTLYAKWAKADLTKAKIKLSTSSYTWNGKAKTPKVIVTFNGKTLKNKTDYTVSYSGNKEPGTAKVTLKGAGVFKKSKGKTAKFTISKATQTITANDVIYKYSWKGKTVDLKATVKNSDGTKLHFYSNSSAVKVLDKNKNKLKLNSAGAAVITIKADETKHYKAASKKVKIVQQVSTAQVVEGIQLKQSFMKYDKAKGLYILNKEIFNQAFQVSVKGRASYTCSVENGAKTSAWLDKNMRLTARGNGVFTLKITTKLSPDKVYPAATKKISISVKGMANSATAKWRYRVDSDSKITLLKYIGSESTVKVPDTITIDSKKFTVKDIEASAFENSKVKKVTISDASIKSIGKNAFKNCKSLQEVRLGTKITLIGSGAFYGCSALKSITFPDGLKTIEAELMKGCSALSGELYLPKSLTTIKKDAFENCGKINEIMIFSFLATVESNAFKGCSGLKKVYFSGPKVRWKGIKFAAGNENLTGAQIYYNAGGGNNAYEVTDITTEMLLREYPEYLKNDGYRKVLNDLQNDCFTIMSGHTTGTFSDEWWATLKSMMQEGHSALLKAVLEDPKYTEEKTYRSLALELIVDTAGYSLEDEDKDKEWTWSDELKKTYKILKKFKSVGDKIFKDEDTMKQVAKELSQTGWSYDEVLATLKYMNGTKELPLKPGQKKPDTVQRWDYVNDCFKGADIAVDTVDFLMTVMSVQFVGKEFVDRVITQLPADSGLYNGVMQVKQYMEQPISIFLKDFLVEDVIEKYAVELFDKTMFEPMWENGTSYVGVVAMADTICGAMACMMDCPTLEAHNKAWFSLNNAMVLRLQTDKLRAQLIAAKNAKVENLELEKNYELMMRLYLMCLKKTGGYVAKTMSDPYILNAKFARFDSTLTYENYIMTCKWSLADSGKLK